MGESNYKMPPFSIILTDVFTNSNVNNSSGCILFLCSCAVALFKYVNAAGNLTSFLFDLDCRNSRGITKPGFSVFINFDTLFQIGINIEEAYQLLGRIYPPYFQVEFISVIVDTDDLAIIQSSQISYFRRMKRQQKQEKQGRQKRKNPRMAKMRASFKSSPRHEEAKKVIEYVKRQKQEK